RPPLRRAGLTFLLSLLFARHAAAAPKIDPDDLRRGLVTTYKDGARPAPRELVRREPTVALALKAGESPHPLLAADGGTVVWKGYVNVIRAGNYRFRARLRGAFRLRVGDREMLAAD